MGDTWTDEFGDPVLNTGFRVTEHVPGYTGFIPKMQHIHSLTFTTSTKVAMSCHPTPDLETVKNEFTKARRQLQTGAPLAGTGFLGFVSEPVEEHSSRYRQYWQGSPVNLNEYYKDQQRKVDKLRIENPKELTQRKNPIRNTSQIIFGDDYYFSGKHMYESTMKESYEEAKTKQSISDTLRLRTGSALGDTGSLPSQPLGRTLGRDGGSSPSTSVNSRSTHVKLDETGRARCKWQKSKYTVQALTPEPDEDLQMNYRYKVAQALVGKARLDRLHEEIEERLTAKVVASNKDMMNIFNMYAMIGKELGHPVIGYEELRSICQKLGVYMSTKEALALFARYDDMSDHSHSVPGTLDYFELIKVYFGSGSKVLTDQQMEEKHEDDE